MNAFFTARDEDGRRRIHRRHLVWLVPLGVTVGVGMFIGVGFLVAWLWRVTVVEIFAFKPISFWQAWGLILLSQILFKANVRQTTRTGRWRRRGHPCGDPAGMAPEQPLGEREG
jgi:amino acid permease